MASMFSPPPTPPALYLRTYSIYPSSPPHLFVFLAWRIRLGYFVRLFSMGVCMSQGTARIGCCCPTSDASAPIARIDANDGVYKRVIPSCVS